jgi:hypothetical protein
MNRRSVIKGFIGVPLIFLPGVAQAKENWIVLGRRVLKPTTRSVSLAINPEFSRLGIELHGNAIWLYDMTIVGPGGKSTTLPVNLNVPPTSSGCLSRIRLIKVVERPKKLLLNLESLPLTSKPTEVLFWGMT